MNKTKVRALKVSQPLGDFYVISIKAKLLKEISFSEPLEYKSEDGSMRGNQRLINQSRLKEIGKYIDTAEMTFPNSIILSVNHNNDGSTIENDEERWEIIQEGDDFYLDIPNKSLSASIIDGQHRMQGFNHVNKPERLEMDLLCSVFFDLPNPYQAYLFATINGNQKRVDKSLALEQFGYFIAEEEAESWTPEKLSANITRKLNFNTDSPLYSVIKLAPLYDNKDFKINNDENWLISTSAIMEGILSLISSNYKRDRIEMMEKKIFSGRNRKMLKNINDQSPLRKLFLNNEDDKIEQIVFSFFNSVKTKLWENNEKNTYIKKTVGIQALFSLLKESLKVNNYKFDPKIIDNISNIDFSNDYFQASGIGKTRLRNVMFIKNKYKNMEELVSQSDIEKINYLIGN